MRDKIDIIDIKILETPYVFDVYRTNHWHFDQTMEMPGFWHSLEYMAKGKYKIVKDSGEYTVSANTLSLSRFVSNYYTESVDLPTHMYIMRIVTDKPVLSAEQPNITSNPSNPQKIEGLFLKLIETNALKSPTYMLEMKEIAYKILVSLFNDYFSEKEKSTLPSSMITAIEYINGNIWDKPITIREISEHLNLSTEYFIRAFKKTFNTTPKQYINNLKLNKAAEFISSTNRKITDIAELSGFSDMHNFNKLFKNKFGMSPKEFRFKNLSDV